MKTRKVYQMPLGDSIEILFKVPEKDEPTPQIGVGSDGGRIFIEGPFMTASTLDENGVRKDFFGVAVDDASDETVAKYERYAIFALGQSAASRRIKEREEAALTPP